MALYEPPKVRFSRGSSDRFGSNCILGEAKEVDFLVAKSLADTFVVLYDLLCPL